MANEILGQLFSIMNRNAAAASSASTPRQATQGGQTDEQKVYAKMLDAAVKEGNLQRIQTLEPGARRAGVPVAPYLEAAGAMSPEQEAQNFIGQLISESLGLAPQKRDSAIPQGMETEVAVNEPEGLSEKTRTPFGQARETLEQIFTPEFTARMLAKKASGIDISEESMNNLKWFQDYLELPDTLSATEKKEVLAAKYGFIPAEASQLKDLSLEERKSVVRGLIAKYMQDSKVDSTVKKFFPQVDHDKTKMGFILDQLIREGYPIPDEGLPFFYRFIQLSDDMADFEAQKIARETATREATKTRTQYALESEKPISAEDRAKYGVGSKIPTYTELADQGFRFPSEADRKMYNELSAVRDQIVEMENLLFGSKEDPASGLFVGIGDDWVSRKSAQATWLKQRATGETRGQNYEIYSDVLASMARRLLALAGESGGRFTDVDVQQITRSAPDIGGAISVPDSETIARRKFERFVVGLNKRLSDIGGGVILKPTGGTSVPAQKSQPAAPAAAPAKSDQFQTGKIYRDANGNRAKYLGDGKWQKMK